ncbi:MAG TPA: helix-turn-helix transcriptional regulator [Anaerolineae bacterium]|nr:helix-turn-helix transcriptional regulator [Anaerolineae bacterium]
MGNLYRFTEPIVLLVLARLGTTHGYQIAAETGPLAVTHAGLDGAAIYRALRRLEATNCVASNWDTSGGGPARRLYTMTPRGWEHLGEWTEVMASIDSALSRLLRETRRISKAAPQASLRTTGRT